MGRHIAGLFGCDYDPNPAGFYILGPFTSKEEPFRTNLGISQPEVRRSLIVNYVNFFFFFFVFDASLTAYIIISWRESRSSGNIKHHYMIIHINVSTE